MNNAMQKHEQFILDALLPAVATHARLSGSSMTEAAMAAFLSLGTILQSQGFTADSLMAAIKASALSTHDAPEGLQ